MESRGRPENPRPKILEVPQEGNRTHAVLHLFRPRPCDSSSENELGALAYLSRTPGAKRWVVVLPIWGSSTYPSNKIVRRLLGGAHGRQTNVLWIQGPKALIRYEMLMKVATEAEFLAEASRTASCIDATVEDVRAFIDWMMEQPDIDLRRVGIVGFSIGGIVGSLVMGRDPRLAAGVFVMAGGHLDDRIHPSAFRQHRRKVDMEPGTSAIPTWPAAGKLARIIHISITARGLQWR